MRPLRVAALLVAAVVGLPACGGFAPAVGPRASAASVPARSAPPPAAVAPGPADRRALERALERDPRDTASHARLAALTGVAPAGEPASLAEAGERAEQHPYDPRALAEAGVRLAAAGDAGAALPLLERAVSLADRDPGSAERAIAALRELSPDWRGRRVVPVAVYVDARRAQEPGWRFAQRFLWADLSASFDPVLHTRFLPVSLESFDGAALGEGLAPVLREVRHLAGAHQQGIVAAFGAPPAAERPGAARGLADYLGRTLAVRDDADVARVLAHELAHLYGGVHVAPELPSLMNASGDSRRLDPLNARILRALAARTFGPGGTERNVIPHLDRGEAIAALEDALALNLTYRRLGLDRWPRGLPPGGAERRARAVGVQDQHLADVSRFLARLLWDDGQQARAVALLEMASRLYGADTERGRDAHALAAAMRAKAGAAAGVR